MDPARRRSLVTVVVAGAANLLIAIAKLVAGLVSGSAALMAEAAHSFADTLNQVFLVTALQRSHRPADRGHPFGYGKERYFWSLLAAVAVFVLGAGFSVLEGVSALVSGGSTGPVGWAYAALAIAFVFDGTSLARAWWQVRRDAAESDTSVWQRLGWGSDPTARAVLFEDTAGVIGVLLAAGGLALDELLGTRVWDATASLAIGALLIAVAFTLGRQNRDLLIGRAVPPRDLDAIRAALMDTEGVHEVIELLTMQLGPEEVLVAARVALAPDTAGEQAERVADRADERIRSENPQVRHVFLDPTPAGAEAGRLSRGSADAPG